MRRKGQFVPVMEANLTLSFDHRVIDGGAAGRLLPTRLGIDASAGETVTHSAWPPFFTLILNWRQTAG